MTDEEKKAEAPDALEMKSEEKPKKKGSSKKDKKEKKAPTKKTELDKAGAITVTQFLRSENLGYLKQGFAFYIKEKGVGGRKTRQEWMKLFQIYRSSPISAFTKRKGG